MVQQICVLYLRNISDAFFQSITEENQVGAQFLLVDLNEVGRPSCLIIFQSQSSLSYSCSAGACYSTCFSPSYSFFAEFAIAGPSLCVPAPYCQPLSTWACSCLSQSLPSFFSKILSCLDLILSSDSRASLDATVSTETASTFMFMPSFRLWAGLFTWVRQAMSHLNPTSHTSQQNTSVFFFFLAPSILPMYFSMPIFSSRPTRVLVYRPVSISLEPFCASSSGSESCSLRANFFLPKSSTSVTILGCFLEAGLASCIIQTRTIIKLSCCSSYTKQMNSPTYFGAYIFN